MPDSWELSYGLNTSETNIDLDTDADGFSDMEEYISGTSPIDSNDHFNFQGSHDADAFFLQFETHSGRNYTISVSTDLNEWHNWSVVSGDGATHALDFNPTNINISGLELGADAYFFKIEVENRLIMKIKTLTLLVLCTFSVSALLAVPSTINYQGLIADVEGTPIESTMNSISVGLFATELDGDPLIRNRFLMLTAMHTESIQFKLATVIYKHS